jgi:hypothetical protein
VTLDLDAIKARCEAATPGPWEWDRDDEGLVSQSVTDTEHGEFGTILARYPRLVATGYPCKEGTGFPDYDGPNGRFIAHARTDVPALVAEVERLRAALNQTPLTLTLRGLPVRRDRRRPR